MHVGVGSQNNVSAAAVSASGRPCCDLILAKNRQGHQSIMAHRMDPSGPPPPGICRTTFSLSFLPCFLFFLPIIFVNNYIFFFFVFLFLRTFEIQTDSTGFEFEHVERRLPKRGDSWARMVRCEDHKTAAVS